MRSFHMPFVDARYWLGIVLASIFGTNLGDFYAHNSGLGIGLGLVVLCCLALTVVLIERVDDEPRELYYWLVIIVIRTGATNIADGLASRGHIPRIDLSVGFGLMLALLAWRSAKAARVPVGRDDALPDTGALYWTAMLVAGVLGTVLGDVLSHAFGQGLASIGLGALLVVALLSRKRIPRGGIGLYWLIVAIARTAGTAIGDWFAENKALQIGLPLSTLVTGLAFVGVLLFWRSRRGRFGTVSGSI